MSILPVQAAAPLLAAAPVVSSAIEAASARFAGLLKGGRTEFSSTGPATGGLGLEGLVNESRAVAASLDPAAPQDLRNRTVLLLEQFHQSLGTLLAEHGIDPGDGFGLAFGGSGAIRVTGGHPDGARIEALINGSPELRSLFGQIARNSASLRATGAAHQAANHVESRRFGLVVGPKRTTIASG